VSLLRTGGRIAPWLMLTIALMCWGHGLWIFAKAQLAQVLISRSFADTLLDGKIHKPWPWADTWPVAKIQFPKQHKIFYVLDGYSGSALAFGPGMESTPDSALRVIQAHRDTHFAVLNSLQPGDPVQLQDIHGQWTNYSVADLRVYDERRGPLQIDTSTPQLILMTCYPFDSPFPGGPLRYVVSAAPISTERASQGVRGRLSAGLNQKTSSKEITFAIKSEN